MSCLEHFDSCWDDRSFCSVPWKPWKSAKMDVRWPYKEIKAIWRDGQNISESTLQYFQKHPLQALNSVCHIVRGHKQKACFYEWGQGLAIKKGKIHIAVTKQQAPVVFTVDGTLWYNSCTSKSNLEFKREAKRYLWTWCISHGYEYSCFNKNSKSPFTITQDNSLRSREYVLCLS